MFKHMNLFLFDEGGAPAAAESTAAAAETPAKSAKKGAYDNVVFGKQTGEGEITNATEPASDVSSKPAQTTSNALEDKRKAFRDLVNGEYKDIYTEETQRLINRRFGEQQQLNERLQSQQSVIDMLMQRYNVNDLGKLQTALENDDAYWSEAAEESGMTVEQYKQFQKLQRENAALQAEQHNRQEQERTRQQAEQWYREAQDVKAKFPKFDLGAELQNQQFVNMLRAGTPVEHAYKVMHFDELMGNAVQVTAANTEKAVADNVRARGARPSENGTNAQSAFTVKDDPSKLSRKDFEEIARRVARGERITF